MGHKGSGMKILIHLGNHLISEAIGQLLVRNGYDSVVTGTSSKSVNFKPDIVMVDIHTIDQEFLGRFPMPRSSHRHRP